MQRQEEESVHRVSRDEGSGEDGVRVEASVHQTWSFILRRMGKHGKMEQGCWWFNC